MIRDNLQEERASKSRMRMALGSSVRRAEDLFPSHDRMMMKSWDVGAHATSTI